MASQNSKMQGSTSACNKTFHSRVDDSEHTSPKKKKRGKGVEGGKKLSRNKDKHNAKLLNFVNKPLKHLEDLRLIVGDDATTGAFSKSVFEDLDSQQSDAPNNIHNEVDTPTDMTQFEARKKTVVTETSATRTTQVPRKRNIVRDKVQLEDDRELSLSIDRVAIAIVESHWTGKLESRLKEFASKYPRKMLDLATRTLSANEKEAMVFSILSTEERDEWLMQFAKDHGLGASDDGDTGGGGRGGNTEDDIQHIDSLLRW